MRYLSGIILTHKIMGNKKSNDLIYRPKTQSEFNRIHNELTKRGFVACDVLKPGTVKNISLAMGDPSSKEANEMATGMERGSWSNGPLIKVAWSFDAGRNDSIVEVKDKDGQPMGPGYVKWGAGNNIPSVIPVLAQASPYTAAPLRYIADLTAGLGPKLMYRFPDGKLVEFKDAGEILLQEIEDLEATESPIDDLVDGLEEVIMPEGQQREKKESKALKRAREAYETWKKTWYGYDEKDELDISEHIPGSKEFLEENNLNLHLSQCEQDDVMLDIYFPTVGFNTRGRRKSWNPRITKVGVLPCHSTRLGKMGPTRHIDWVYFSDQWRTLGLTGAKTVGTTDNNIVMYPAAMPQHLLHELRYAVESNQKSRIKERPMWIVCPTFYPSGNKPYYPQPAWWSVFTSKAFDFSATILYDKYKNRENNTTWGRIIYISLDYLDQIFADEGYKGKPEAQQKFIDDLESAMENFLQHRENNGKMMRQWMWIGPDGKEHENVKIVDVAETKQDAIKAGKEELELSTSPIFLALQVDPRLVGVPMVSPSNGGTALRELHLLKQQQLNVKQRLYLQFLNSIVKFNQWDEHAEFHIVQQTLTTLDNSKTGTVETISGEGA